MPSPTLSRQPASQNPVSFRRPTPIVALRIKVKVIPTRARIEDHAVVLAESPTMRYQVAGLKSGKCQIMSNRSSRRLVAGIAALSAIILAAGPAGAGTVDLRVTYAASISGIPVGKANVEAQLAGSEYAITGSGRVAGITALFADGKGRIQVNGKLQDQVIRPARYSQTIIEDKKKTLDMTFSGTQVINVTMTLDKKKKKRAQKNPKKKKGSRAIPVTEQHKKDVIDPLSVFLLPAAEMTGEGVCNRTLPLFDGEQRFDVVMTFDRKSVHDTRPVFVCSIAYRPIAGHKPGKKSVEFMVNNKKMEVWLAPIGKSGFVAPVEAHVKTRIGMLAIKATSFKVEP